MPGKSTRSANAQSIDIFTPPWTQTLRQNGYELDTSAAPISGICAFKMHAKREGRPCLSAVAVSLERARGPGSSTSVPVGCSDWRSTRHDKRIEPHSSSRTFRPQNLCMLGSCRLPSPKESTRVASFRRPDQTSSRASNKGAIDRPSRLRE